MTTQANAKSATQFVTRVC